MSTLTDGPKHSTAMSGGGGGGASTHDLLGDDECVCVCVCERENARSARR